MGSLSIRPSRLRDVLDVAGYYNNRDPATETTHDPVSYYNSPNPRGLNRKQRRAERSKLRRKKLL